MKQEPVHRGPDVPDEIERSDEHQDDGDRTERESESDRERG